MVDSSPQLPDEVIFALYKDGGAGYPGIEGHVRGLRAVAAHFAKERDDLQARAELAIEALISAPDGLGAEAFEILLASPAGTLAARDRVNRHTAWHEGWMAHHYSLYPEIWPNAKTANPYTNGDTE